MFAHTGGDGVHFSLLTDIGEASGRSPVVMTVPVAETNIVLAESLDEFLGLGYHNGWFALEQLAYDFDETIEYYSIPDDSASVQQTNFLTLIREELKIKHVPLTKSRLDELATLYNHRIMIQTG